MRRETIRKPESAKRLRKRVRDLKDRLKVAETPSPEEGQVFALQRAFQGLAQDVVGLCRELYPHLEQPQRDLVDTQLRKLGVVVKEKPPLPSQRSGLAVVRGGVVSKG